MKKTKKLTVRICSKLLSKWKRFAKKNKSTLQREIEYLLKEKFEDKAFKITPGSAPEDS